MSFFRKIIYVESETRTPRPRSSRQTCLLDLLDTLFLYRTFLFLTLVWFSNIRKAFPVFLYLERRDADTVFKVADVAHSNT